MDQRTKQNVHDALGDKVAENVPLASFTTFKIGGPADLFYEARTRDDLVLALRTGRKFGIPVTVLGGGTNILISDKGIRGMVVRNVTSRITVRGIVGSRTRSDTAADTVFVEADSGVSMNKLVRFTLEEGFSGLEMHLGLPGSVGGAICMNSKWMHPEGSVGDVLYQAEILDPDGAVRNEPRDYFRFSYGSSRIQSSGDIVLGAVFALRRMTKEYVWAVAEASIAHRRTTQPQGISSAGCIFKNLTKAQAMAASTPNLTTSAGFLIDQAGWKGKRIGGAQVSAVHANFITNAGSATARDVLELIESIRNDVKRRWGVTLMEEVVRIGDFS